MLVLPLPVGPVTSTMPQGLLIATSSFLSESSSNPSFVMSSISFDLSRRRMTIFSPKSVGRHDTRKSMSLETPSSEKRILMRPSWGRRFSEISSFAMILTREVIASRILSGGDITG